MQVQREESNTRALYRGLEVVVRFVGISSWYSVREKFHVISVAVIEASDWVGLATDPCNPAGQASGRLGGPSVSFEFDFGIEGKRFFIHMPPIGAEVLEQGSGFSVYGG